MPTDYTVDDPLDHGAIAAMVAASLNVPRPEQIERVGHGSTNLIYRVSTSGKPLIVKVSHRADRITAGVLTKELDMLERFQGEQLPLPIPIVHWRGQTVEGYPAAILSQLDGQPIGALLSQATNLDAAFRLLGRFNAAFNRVPYASIDEFEVDRPSFTNFSDCVTHWLKAWQPLLVAADPAHVSQEQLALAEHAILDRLGAFDDTAFSFVHADLSNENVLGSVVDGQLVLTGVCDFETVQTGPAEYDLGSAWNNYFVHHPELEAPFLAGYQSSAALHPRHEDRLIACSLFRGLRYIKRSVKYQETHYYEHDRQFLEAWLERARLSSEATISTATEPRLR